MNPTQDVIILPFQPENQAEVKNLILAGLAEHWGTIDPSKNLDLNDICSTYANAVFLVARLQNRIIGTGALVPKSNNTAEVVRMSVAADMRRQGIASQILQDYVTTPDPVGIGTWCLRPLRHGTKLLSSTNGLASR